MALPPRKRHSDPAVEKLLRRVERQLPPGAVTGGGRKHYKIRLDAQHMVIVSTSSKRGGTTVVRAQLARSARAAGVKLDLD